jgi:hypothetical protein
MGKKSKYNLFTFRLLKVPISIFEKYKEAYSLEDWAERARDVLDLATHALPSPDLVEMKEDNEE